jgi:hypothetical protein
MRDAIAAGNSVFLISTPDGADIEQLKKWLLFPRGGFVSVSAQTWLASEDARKLLEKETADESECE